MQSIRRPQHVDVLIDWNSQFHLMDDWRDGSDTPALTRKVLKSVCRRVGTLLVRVSPDRRFQLRLRAYHGWYKGFEPTPRRRAAISAQVLNPNDPEDPGLAGYSAHPTSVAVRDFQFGDRLLFARDARLHERLGCHLPGTLQVGDHGDEEKMVDTALASDLCYLALREESWIVVVGQDRDLVPALFVAEAAMEGTSRRLFFLAKNRIKHVNLKGLLCQ